MNTTTETTTTINPNAVAAVTVNAAQVLPKAMDSWSLTLKTGEVIKTSDLCKTETNKAETIRLVFQCRKAVSQALKIKSSQAEFAINTFRHALAVEYAKEMTGAAANGRSVLKRFAINKAGDLTATVGAAKKDIVEKGKAPAAAKAVKAPSFDELWAAMSAEDRAAFLAKQAPAAK